MEKHFKYDAFISYRHTELDKFVAEKLHRQLEAFNLPKSVAKKRPGEKQKIERVFRDKEELPLTSNLEDPILQALNDSEWLIVICSPRLRESLWCKKEIENFIALRGREHVLAVLVEGEPAEAFPDELLYECEQHTLPDGTVEEIRRPMEPLAADVRGKTKKEVVKALKTEGLRILAAMFQMDYDDLRQRHRERRMRRIVSASLLGGATCLLFGVYSTATAIRIHNQKEQIAVQAEEIRQQSVEIQQQSGEIMKQNQELALRQARSLAELAAQSLESGDRAGAVKMAVEALTESEGIALPYTPRAQYVLAEGLRVYDTGNVYKAEYQYEMAGRIEFMEISPDADTLAIYDDARTLVLFDLEKGETIETIGSNEYDYWGEGGCTFLGEDRFAYIKADDMVCIYDFNEGKVVGNIQADYVSRVYADKAGKYLVVKEWDNTFMVYDGVTMEVLGNIPEVDSGTFLGGPYIFEEGIFACAYPSKAPYGSEKYTMYFVDLNTMDVFSTYFMGDKKVESMNIRDGIAYVVSSEYTGLMGNSDGYLSAIDMETGKVLWEHVQKGYWAETVCLPVNEGAEKLLFVTDGNISLVNMLTGEVVYTEPLFFDTIASYVYLNMNAFLLFGRSGEMVMVDGEEEEEQCFDLGYKFDCKTMANEQIYHSPYGVVVLEQNDNKITVYTMETGPDVVETDREISSLKDMIITGEEASEIAQSYGLGKPEFVYSLYFSENEKYCFIQYWDGSFVIYDVQRSEICNTIEEAYPTTRCLGTDAEGYTYLQGSRGCYMLNADMEPVMWLADAAEVDMINQKVYLTWNNHNYEAPLYSLEELLQMAVD